MDNEQERDEKALAALREHEKECSNRALEITREFGKVDARFAKIETSVKNLAEKVAGNTRVMYWFGTTIFGGVVLMNIREWFL